MGTMSARGLAIVYRSINSSSMATSLSCCPRRKDGTYRPSDDRFVVLLLFSTICAQKHGQGSPPSSSSRMGTRMFALLSSVAIRRNNLGPWMGDVRCSYAMINDVLYGCWIRGGGMKFSLASRSLSPAVTPAAAPKFVMSPNVHHLIVLAQPDTDARKFLSRTFLHADCGICWLCVVMLRCASYTQFSWLGNAFFGFRSSSHEFSSK
mmetsp:Transcript_9149/g.26132  ORF Transcript_9149/g.26132 Transcript_9149/m.26132 type:complete len:207 (-) Transcript_9149:284-904(-)